MLNKESLQDCSDRPEQPYYTWFIILKSDIKVRTGGASRAKMIMNKSK